MSYGTYAGKECCEPAAAKSANRGALGSLRVGDPDNSYEREADRVAEEIMAGGALKHHWSLSSMGISAPLQRKCACGGPGGSDGQCEECKRKEEGQPTVQRKASGAGAPEFAPPIVHEVLNSPGQPLDTATREFFEPRFGQEFASIRLHRGDTACESAHAVGAQAYTVGNHIVVGSKMHDNAAEKRLLAHELAHSIQQGGLGRSPRANENKGSDRRTLRTPASPVLARKIEDDDPKQGQPKPAQGLRTNGLTPEEKTLLKSTRQTEFAIPSSKSNIAGVLIDDETGKKYPVESGEFGGPYGGTHRGGIPRGRGEGFSGGAPTEKNIVTHIEGHAAAIMREQGIKRGTLLSPEPPCKVCSHPERTPAVSTVLPPKTRLTVVYDEGAETFFSSALPSSSTGAATAEPTLGAGNLAPDVAAGKTLGEVLEEQKGGKLGGGLGKTLATEEAIEAEALAPTMESGTLAELALSEVLGLATALVTLIATAVWELVIAPKINALLASLQAQRAKELKEQIQKEFQEWESQHVNRVIKYCFLNDLQKYEKQGKTAHVKVQLRVAFEDTSNRLQLFTETPPESIYDIRLYGLKLMNVELTDSPVEASVSKMQRCDDCGAFGRSKSFVTNNPLWSQTITFSFKAPSSQRVQKELEETVPKGEQPTLADCATAAACLIATACYGTPNAVEVTVLRRFRNDYMMSNTIGRWLSIQYYHHSPLLAGWLWRHPATRESVRHYLVAPLAWTVQWLFFRNPGNDKEHVLVSNGGNKS